MCITELQNYGKAVSITLTAADLLQVCEGVASNVVAQLNEERQQKTNVPLFRIEDVMNRLNVSRHTLWRWEKTGYLVPVKVGKKNMYRVADVTKLEGE